MAPLLFFTGQLQRQPDEAAPGHWQVRKAWNRPEGGSPLNRAEASLGRLHDQSLQFSNGKEVRGLPQTLPRSPISTREETSPIEHAKNQSLPCDADGFDQRLKRLLHKLKGCDQDSKINAVVRKGKGLRIPLQARRTSEAAGFQQHGP